MPRLVQLGLRSPAFLLAFVAFILLHVNIFRRFSSVIDSLAGVLLALSFFTNLYLIGGGARRSKKAHRAWSAFVLDLATAFLLLWYPAVQLGLQQNGLHAKTSKDDGYSVPRSLVTHSDEKKLRGIYSIGYALCALCFILGVYHLVLAAMDLAGLKSEDAGVRDSEPRAV